MKRYHVPQWTLVVLCVLALTLFVSPVLTTSADQNPLQAAWEKARQSGAYHFSADILQTLTPLPKVTNVGRQSRQDELHLEGQTDIRAQQLSFTLWSQGGSLLDAESGVQIKVENDRAFARRGQEDWQEINDFSGLFAPDGDFMAYLVAVRDVVERTETRAVTFRYLFTLMAVLCRVRARSLEGAWRLRWLPPA
jgi:hypothetical protein